MFLIIFAVYFYALLMDTKNVYVAIYFFVVNLGLIYTYVFFCEFLKISHIKKLRMKFKISEYGNLTTIFFLHFALEG